jgi:hypothetical protein
MVKLVDTPASGAGDRKVVEVRVFFWAPIQTKPSHVLGFVLFGIRKLPRPSRQTLGTQRLLTSIADLPSSQRSERPQAGLHAPPAH